MKIVTLAESLQNTLENVLIQKLRILPRHLGKTIKNTKIYVKRHSPSNAMAPDQEERIPKYDDEITLENPFQGKT